MAKVLNRDGEIQVTLSTNYGLFEGGLEEYDAVLQYTDVGNPSVGQEEGFLGFAVLHTADVSFWENEGGVPSDAERLLRRPQAPTWILRWTSSMLPIPSRPVWSGSRSPTSSTT